MSNTVWKDQISSISLIDEQKWNVVERERDRDRERQTNSGRERFNENEREARTLVENWIPARKIRRFWVWCVNSVDFLLLLLRVDTIYSVFNYVRLFYLLFAFLLAFRILRWNFLIRHPSDSHVFVKMNWTSTRNFLFLPCSIKRFKDGYYFRPI